MAVTSMLLGEIARHLGGTLEGGDPKREITSIEPVQDAGPDAIAFISNKRCRF